MKTSLAIASPLLAAVLAISAPLHAQTTTETTTTAAAVPSDLNSAGTISTFSPDSITVTSQSATTPMQYTATKTTTYVDDAGNPVSMETVKSGLPVTVYYTQSGGQMVASRVVVKQSAPATGAVETKKTTTTTIEQ